MKEVSLHEQRNYADNELNTYIHWLEESGRLTVEEAAKLQSHINALIDLTITIEQREATS